MNLNKLIHKLKQLPRQSFPGGGETVTTNAATNIEGKQLTINGNLSGGEETTVTSLGFTFGTNSGGNNPFTASSNAVGTFSQTPTALTTGETYYFRARALVGEDEPSFIEGNLLSVVNSPTFKGSGQITMTELKEAFDSPEASANVSLDFLSQTSGLNKSSNISYSDFYNNDPSLTVFYRGGSCSSTTTTATYHGGSGTVPTNGDYIFTAQVGGRVNFLSNGTYGFNTNGLNSQTVTRQFTVSSGKVTSVLVCQSNRCLTLDMPIYINNKLDIVNNVKVGDIVKTPDTNSKVVYIERKIREGYYILDNELKITSDHLIYHNNKWILPNEYTGTQEYINIPTEVIYIETENGELTIPLSKNWIVSAKY